MDEQGRTRPASYEELQKVAALHTGYVAMAGDFCGGDGCHKPMTQGQPFYSIGHAPRRYVCALCALAYVRAEA